MFLGLLPPTEVLKVGVLGVGQTRCSSGGSWERNFPPDWLALCPGEFVDSVRLNAATMDLDHEMRDKSVSWDF